MIPYPNIKPYIVKFGPLQLRWYGLMYILGFICSYLLVEYQLRRKRLELYMQSIDDVYSFLILGLIVGARIGYIIFYNLNWYIENPLDIFAVWKGGMSFHGGLIGTLIAGVYITTRRKLDFWIVADLVIVTVPIGLGLGRIGNFINGELYGRVTNVPWAMVFPGGGRFPRHPSQLYEAFFEGIILFTIMWFLKDRIKMPGFMTAIFLICYGVIRFSIEFFREPDPQLGFIISFLTMGQILSLLMLFGGLLIFALRRFSSK